MAVGVLPYGNSLFTLFTCKITLFDKLSENETYLVSFINILYLFDLDMIKSCGRCIIRDAFFIPSEIIITLSTKRLILCCS